ncbi:MAG: NAD-dependent dihydropyrimidine dehydrogenase subunit PreA [Pseudomonadota bacterium]
MYPKPKTNLSINFCGVEFAHPFILAAAPPTDDLDMVRDGLRAGWSGAVLKTTSVEKTEVHLAYPMMSGIDYNGARLIGMGNIDLISEHHIDEVERRIRTLKSEFKDKRIIASISGQDKDSWQALAKRTADAGADMIECSFSCPQGSMGLKPGAMLGQSAKASAEVAGWIKKAAGKVPIIIKLTPQVEDIAEMALAVKGAGADAVCVGNTLPVLMGVDPNSWVPFPNVYDKSTYSGLSGPAIKPVSLKCVAEVAKKAKMPIAGSGGAVTWQDTLEYLLLGATVVEFCTAVMHYGFDIVTDLIEGLSSYLEKRGIKSLREIMGASLNKIVSHDDLFKQNGAKGFRPSIDEDSCVRCGLCVIACRDGAHRAIELNSERLPQIDDEKCVGCALCSVICPAYCIEMVVREEKK